MTVPVHALFRDGQLIPAQRGASASADEIAAHLRNSITPIVLVNVAFPFVWHQGPDRFTVWKSELKPRLVAPGHDSVCLEDFPDGRCYRCTLWHQEEQPVALVFECYH